MSPLRSPKSNHPPLMQNSKKLKIEIMSQNFLSHFTRHQLLAALNPTRLTQTNKRLKIIKLQNKTRKKTCKKKEVIERTNKRKL